jgi:8-oxo-dGTP pyrophosphatase MutT (NUDIX family)
MWFEEVERLLAAGPIRRLDLGGGLTRAAVLVPLYVDSGELWVLLTRRADALPRHAGQIALPGGAHEAGDGDEVDTALREAHEELGVDPAAVMVLGQLDDVWTPTGFAISPIVGAIPHPITVTPSPTEIEAVVRVPFRSLADPRLVEFQELAVEGHTVLSPVYHYQGYRVWGATARVIADLVSRLTGAAPDWAREG